MQTKLFQRLSVAFTKYKMKEKHSETRKLTLGAVRSQSAVSNLRIFLLSVRIIELYHAKISLRVSLILVNKPFIQQVMDSLDIMQVSTAIASL